MAAERALCFFAAAAFLVLTTAAGGIVGLFWQRGLRSSGRHAQQIHLAIPPLPPPSAAIPPAPLPPATPQLALQTAPLVYPVEVMAPQLHNVTCARGAEPSRWPMATGHPSVPHGALNILLVVPGIGSVRRARIVLFNLRRFRGQFRSCLIFTHRRCGDDAELDKILDASPSSPFVVSKCEVVRSGSQPAGGYLDNLKLLLPALVESSGYDHVLIMQDDVEFCGSKCVASSPAFNLSRLSRVAMHNGLHVASPRVHGASWHFAQILWAMPKLNESSHREAAGYYVAALEMYTWLVTPPAYRCLYELIDLGLNRVGWGFDLTLHSFCSKWKSLAPFRMGVVAGTTVVHIRNLERTANGHSMYAKETAQRDALRQRDDLARRGIQVDSPTCHPSNNLCNTRGPLRDPEHL